MLAFLIIHCTATERFKNVAWTAQVHITTPTGSSWIIDASIFWPCSGSLNGVCFRGVQLYTFLEPGYEARGEPVFLLPSTSQSSKARFCVNECSSRSAQDPTICSEGDLPNYKPLLDYILAYKEALPRPNAGQHKHSNYIKVIVLHCTYHHLTSSVPLTHTHTLTHLTHPCT